jgi:hypothetical protein
MLQYLLTRTFPLFSLSSAHRLYNNLQFYSINTICLRLLLPDCSLQLKIHTIIVFLYSNVIRDPYSKNVDSIDYFCFLF